MQNPKPNNLDFCQFKFKMRDCQLPNDFASLNFKFCDEHPHFTIKQLVKLVEKANSRVCLKKKADKAAAKKQTEVKIIKSFKIWKLITEKN